MWNTTMGVTSETINMNITPLHVAVSQQQPAIVKLLLKEGAEVDRAKGDGNTPLHLAAFNGNSDIVQILLAHGADRWKKNRRSETADTIARRKGHDTIVDLIRRNSGEKKPDGTGFVTLDMFAMEFEHRDGKASYILMLDSDGMGILATKLNGELKGSAGIKWEKTKDGITMTEPDGDRVTFVWSNEDLVAQGGPGVPSEDLFKRVKTPNQTLRAAQ